MFIIHSYSIGLFISNFLWNTFLMYKPVQGKRSTYREYFTNGTARVIAYKPTGVYQTILLTQNP
ncbi:MAG: hypothetical protein JXR41_09250 [Bacteroidales bacterium]|nr:hypothetical protein [Bacteroidales bacterium]